jgi:hypothetical protein
VTLKEWLDALPPAFVKVVRGMGKQLLERHAPMRGGAQMAMGDHRGKARRAHEVRGAVQPTTDNQLTMLHSNETRRARRTPPCVPAWGGRRPDLQGARGGAQATVHAKKKRDAKDHSSKVHVHTEAARAGASAVEIDLFKHYDTDHSGSLTAREIRQALAKVKNYAKKHNCKVRCRRAWTRVTMERFLTLVTQNHRAAHAPRALRGAARPDPRGVPRADPGDGEHDVEAGRGRGRRGDDGRVDGSHARRLQGRPARAWPVLPRGPMHPSRRSGTIRPPSASSPASTGPTTV